jgi:tRNA nucleotidyltransferase (CCA-adding enzyme)
LVNIASEIKTRIPRESLDLVKVAGVLASDQGLSLYLVGGTVRDILLGRPNLDLDLVVEGDAPSLARRLAKLTGGSVKTHPRFGTATVRHGETALDIVTARSETYSRPGALPAVKPGTLDDDLYRRDFTINAMAVSLAPSRFGELVDPHGGKGELDRGLLRVLHDNSFKDDPTRIWRAIRYEQRLGFNLEPNTERLLRRDLATMDAVSGDRLRHEIERILLESRPERSLDRALELGALQQLSPPLEGDSGIARRFERARSTDPASAPEMPVYLALLAWALDRDDIDAFIRRLSFGRHVAGLLRDVPALRSVLPSLEAGNLLPSHICRALDRHHSQAILAASAAVDHQLVRGRLALYLSDLRFVKPVLDGEELKRIGVPEGRKIGRILRVLRDARLNGTVATEGEERALIRQWMAE